MTAVFSSRLDLESAGEDWYDPVTFCDVSTNLHSSAFLSSTCSTLSTNVFLSLQTISKTDLFNTSNTVQKWVHIFFLIFILFIPRLNDFPIHFVPQAKDLNFPWHLPSNLTCSALLHRPHIVPVVPLTCLCPYFGLFLSLIYNNSLYLHPPHTPIFFLPSLLQLVLRWSWDHKHNLPVSHITLPMNKVLNCQKEKFNL